MPVINGFTSKAQAIRYLRSRGFNIHTLLASPEANPKISNDDFVKGSGSNFETRQQPQKVNQSGSTYSYQFKKNQKSENKAKNNADEVYDANYRTINSGQSSQVNQNPDIDEDEEDWV